MAKYVSNKFKDLQVGLSDYSESKTSLEVVGAAVIGGITTISPSGINITGVITATSFSGGDIDGEAVGIIGEDLITRNLKVSGISTFDGNIDIGANGSLDVDGHTELDDVNVTGVATFSNSEGISVNTKIVHTGDTGTNLVFNTGYVSLTADGSARLTAISSPGTHEGVIITGDLRVNNALGVSTFTGGIDVGGTSTIGHLEISDTGIVTAKAGAAITYYGDGSKLTGIDASTIGDLLKINVIGISTFTGETNLNGDVNVGIATTNKITVTGRFDSDLIPYDKDTRDLGNESNKWRNIYVNNINLPGGGTAGEDIVTRNLNISGVSTLSGYVGLGTDLTVAGFSTLSYGAKIGKLDVDNSGIVTAVSGIITYYGDGSYLTGIDATSIKDGDGTVRAQANTSGVVVTGILTATSLEGDGSALTGLPAGLGTAVAASGDGANIYYTNQVLDVGSNLSIDVPGTAVVAYTQYPEIAVASGIDITIADGDDFVSDILGIGTTGAPTPLSGGGGRIRADNFTDRGGSNAPTFPNGVNVTGIVTATTSVQVSSGGTFGSNGASAAVYYGDGSNLTGMANTSDVSTSTLNVVGVSTLGGDVTFKGDNYDVLWDKSTDDLKFPDNAAAKFGTSALSISHNGTDSYISNDTGHLILGAGNGVSIKLQPEGGEDGLTVTHNGSVEAYYDNTKRFETTNTGATITGAGICTSLSVGPGIVQEDFHNYGTALTGTYNHDVVTHGMVLDSTVAASASFVINLRGDGSTTFNSLMNVGQTTVLTVYSVSSNASYYLTDFQIDGSSITEKWNGAAAPSAGTGSGTDVYTFNIMKTASATFSVYANFSNFA